jgi:hypothetical protein
MNKLTSNGTGTGKNVEIPPLPDHLEAEAKSFFANYVHGRHELAINKEKLNEATVHIAELEAQIEGLRSHIATLESRMSSCVLERDQAVAERVTRETILDDIQLLLTKRGVPPFLGDAENEG